MKKLVFIALLLPVISALAIDPMDYFPLTVGNQWVERDSSAELIDTIYSEIVGTTTMLGYNTYLIEAVHSDGSRDTAYYQPRPDGLYTIEFIDEGSGGYPFMVSPNPVNIGDRWVIIEVDTSWIESFYRIHQHVIVHGDAIGFEDITVPAGTFRNCFKIQMSGIYTYDVTTLTGDTLFAGEGSTGVTTVWLAYGVGMAKRHEISEEGEEIVSVLLDYRISNISEMERPDNFSLSISPNPFNSACKISAINCMGNLLFEIFDMNGKMVHLEETDGNSIVWQPSESNASGTYLVRISTSNKAIESKLIYLK